MAILEDLNTEQHLDSNEEKGSFVALPDYLEAIRATPETEGRYDAKREIGRGGNGRVLLAMDAHIGREIALKETRARIGNKKYSEEEQDALHAEDCLRFLREARVTGQLQHPSIIPVHEIGQRSNGSFYYTMRLIKGRTLHEEIRLSPNLEDRLTLLPHFFDLCNAVAYAHSKKVIHRDIKPQNVMIGQFGQTVLLDWGLAKVLTEEEDSTGSFFKKFSSDQEFDSIRTQVGEIMGTPGYMSPEQTLGRVDAIDEQSDVYSLGAVFYEILTGKSPHTGTSIDEVYAFITSGEIVPPQSLIPEIPADLCAIALKALQKKKKNRYSSALEFAKEIESYLSGDKVAAYEYNSFEYLKKMFKKHTAATLSSLVAAAVILVGAVFLFFAYNESEQLRQNEKSARQSAEISEADAHFGLSIALQEKAKSAFDARDYLKSQIFALSALLQNPAFDGSVHNFANFEDKEPESRVQQIAAQSLFLQSRNKTLFTLERSTWAPTEILSFDFAPDGKHLYAVGIDKQIYSYDIPSAQAGKVIGALESFPLVVRVHPKKSILAIGTLDATIHLWNFALGKEVAVLKGATDGILALDFSVDGSLVAAASQDGTCVVFDVESTELLTKLSLHKNQIYSIEFSKDSTVLLSGSRDGSAKITQWRTGQTLHTFTDDGNPLSAATFDPSENKVATSSWSDSVILWDIETHKKIGTFKPSNHPTLSLLFSPDGNYLAASSSGTISVFDTKAFVLAQTLSGYSGIIPNAHFSPSGQALAGFARDGELRLWKLSSDETSKFLGHDRRISDGTLSSNNKILASCGDSGHILVHDTTSSKIIHRLEGHKQEVTFVRFSDDNKRLVSASRDLSVRVWELEGGKQTAECKGHESFALTAHFIPGNRILSTGSDSTVRIWDQDTCKQIAVLEGHNNRGIVSSDIDKSANIAATGGTDNTIVLWDLTVFSKIAVLATLDDWVTHLQFVDNGSKLLASGRDGKILLFDVGKKQLIRQVAQHEDWVNIAIVSSDGQYLLTASDDATVKLWNMHSGKLLRTLYFSDQASVVGFFNDSRQFFYVDDYSVKIEPVVRPKLDQKSLLTHLKLLEKTSGTRLVRTKLVSTTRNAAK